MAGPLISYVLATHNRRELVLATLARLAAIAEEAPAETWVVDNASGDGTAEAIRQQFPRVRLLALRRNRGSCAKALAAGRATAPFVVFLDDDSYPHPGTLRAMLIHFAKDAHLGAASFQVHLPDGRDECSAFPDVFIGCGVGLRRAALEAVGGLDAGFFMQAEEYDLSFRLINAGWTVKTFSDLHVDHLKTPTARLNARTVYFDTRNNLALVARYLSAKPAAVYAVDWAQRYRWIAEQCGHVGSYWRARMAGAILAGWHQRRFADRRLSPQAFERFFRWEEIARRMQDLANDGVRRVLLADLGKNIYPFVAQAFAAGIRPVAVADDRFAAPCRRYRSIPVVPTAQALQTAFDDIVIANTSPVHAKSTAKRLSALADVPVHDWFGSGPELNRPPASTSVPRTIVASHAEHVFSSGVI